MRGHWTPFEDEKLKQLVSVHGPHNWNHIAQHLPGRSGKSCRLRWFNQLDPRINRQAFSRAEEERLVAAHRLYGNKWALIARLFPGRTDNAVKNQWHVITARRLRNSKLVGSTSSSPSPDRHHQYQHRLSRDKTQLPNLHNSSTITKPSPIKTSCVTTSKPTIFNISTTSYNNHNIFQPSLGTRPCPSNSSSLDHDRSISSTSTSTSVGLSDETQHRHLPTQLNSSPPHHHLRDLGLQHDQPTRLPFIDFLGVGSV